MLSNSRAEYSVQARIEQVSGRKNQNTNKKMGCSFGCIHTLLMTGRYWTQCSLSACTWPSGHRSHGVHAAAPPRRVGRVPAPSGPGALLLRLLTSSVS